MTDKQPALFDWATELSDAQGHVTLSEQEAHEIGARLRRLHSENETLQAGYAAARLEIESLRARSVAPAGEYPALPEPDRVMEDWSIGGVLVDYFTTDQMRAYADATCAMHAAQPAGAQQPGAAYAALSDAEIDRIVPALEPVSEDFPVEWALWKDRGRIRNELRASHGQAPAGLAVPSMSADEVNALPTAARAYIHQLATNTDPAGMVRENMQLRDTNAGLQSMYRKAADAAQEVVGCFHAAECEGLQAALAGTADEHLKDLVERRLMHALYAAQEVAGQAPAQTAPAQAIGPCVICGSDEPFTGTCGSGGDPRALCKQPAPQPATTPQADSQPKARFDDPKVQAVYAILCEDAEPPKGEHWEGFAARRIVNALSADSVLEDAARLDWLLLHISGAEFRRIGVHYSGNASRADVDAARKQGANHD